MAIVPSSLTSQARLRASRHVADAVHPTVTTYATACVALCVSERCQAHLLVVPLEMHPARRVVRILRDVLARHDRRARHLRLVHDPHHVGHGAFADPSAQDGVELDALDRLQVGARALPLRVARIETDHAAEAIVDLGQRSQHDPPVGGAEAVERGFR